MTLREETSVQPRPLQIFNVTALVFRYALLRPVDRGLHRK